MNLPLVKSNKPRDHHYVPKCYLKNFVAEKTLFTLDIEKLLLGYNVGPKPDYPKRICYFKDYYTLPKEYNTASFNFNEYDELIIEKRILNRLETRYSKLFDKIISGKNILFSEAIDLCDFIVQLKFRNPYFLAQSEKLKEERVLNIGEDILLNDLNRNPLFDHIPIELKVLALKIVQNTVLEDSNWGKQMQLFSLIKRNSSFDDYKQANTVFRKAMLNCKWRLLCINEESESFLTSDNPGYSLGTDGLVYSSKFTAGFKFYFPLSSKYCLLISDDELDYAFDNYNSEKELIITQLTTSDIQIINNNSIVHRSKIIIGSTPNVLSIIKEELTRNL